MISKNKKKDYLFPTLDESHQTISVVKLVPIFFPTIYIYIYTHTHTHTHTHWAIGLMTTVFTNGPGGWGPISGWVILKAQKMVLDATLLNTQHIRHRPRVKWSNLGNGVLPSPTPLHKRYWKGSLWVTLDCGRQLYFIYTYMLCVHLY